MRQKYLSGFLVLTILMIFIFKSILSSPSIFLFTFFLFYQFMGYDQRVVGWTNSIKNPDLWWFIYLSTSLRGSDWIGEFSSWSFYFYNLIYFSSLISFLSIILKTNNNSINQINVQSLKIQPTTTPSPPSSHLAPITSHISNLYPEM